MKAARWNERYGALGYAYGTAPNQFFKEQLSLLPPGRILLPADGEGRNAVYAATQGWEVYAFDQSEAGQQKALELAAKRGVEINFAVYNSPELPYPLEYFDAIALIYAHFMPAQRTAFHKQFMKLLRPGGTLILEAFNKGHLPYKKANPSVGGPGDEQVLMSLAELTDDFSGLNATLAKDEIVELAEGDYHRGTGSVVRLTGWKS
ncbi:MAG: methyltransferase domain-containing protein [Bacteroidota bacterium]